MEEKRMRRSKDKMIAGVCAGLAEYFNIDPVLMRVAFALMLFGGGFGLPLYIILWIVMPEAEGVTATPVASVPVRAPAAPAAPAAPVAPAAPARPEPAASGGKKRSK